MPITQGNVNVLGWGEILPRGISLLGPADLAGGPAADQDRDTLGYIHHAQSNDIHGALAEQHARHLVPTYIPENEDVERWLNACPTLQMNGAHGISIIRDKSTSEEQDEPPKKRLHKFRQRMRAWADRFYCTARRVLCCA